MLLRTSASVGVVNHGWPISGAAISPDGRLMAIGDERGAVIVYDAATRLPLGPPYLIPAGSFRTFSFSPDGRTLAVSSLDPNARGTTGWSICSTPAPASARLRVRVPPLREPAAWAFTDVVFAPNGRDLLVRPDPGDAPDAAAPPVYHVDGETGAITDRLMLGGYPSYGYASETADRERLSSRARGTT